MLSTLPIDIAVIGFASAVFFMFADTLQTRQFGKYMFMISSMIATFIAWELPNSPSWLLPLWLGQVGLIWLFWVIDLIMPFFKWLSKGVSHK